MESDGYRDPVCEKDKCKEKKNVTDTNDDDNDDDENSAEDEEYEIPEKTETTLTYDILSNSPVELFLFVECLEA